ncbi:hypothetical protein E2542_SST23184 [Spatholobus suberectus]|nr:hypothetical protein E2542_SST23184 [Spatholobus suberectus]
MVRWGPIAVCLVGLEALHALSCPIGACLLDQCEIGPQPPTSIRTPPSLTNPKPTHSQTQLQSFKLKPNTSFVLISSFISFCAALSDLDLVHVLQDMETGKESSDTVGFLRLRGIFKRKKS